MRRLALTSLAVFTFTILFSARALGCDCAPSPPEKPSAEELRAALVKDFKGAAVIFSGKVIEADSLKVKFKVERAWKGEVGKEIVLSTGAWRNKDGGYSWSSCDYEFKPGEKYLVYAYHVDPDLHPNPADLQAYQCTRTKLLEHAEQDVKDLNELVPLVRRVI